MSQMQTCEQCGARIEIVDTDDREPGVEPVNLEEDRRIEVSICENCVISYHVEH